MFGEAPPDDAAMLGAYGLGGGTSHTGSVYPDDGSSSHASEDGEGSDDPDAINGAGDDDEAEDPIWEAEAIAHVESVLGYLPPPSPRMNVGSNYTTVACNTFDEALRRAILAVVRARRPAGSRRRFQACFIESLGNNGPRHLGNVTQIANELLASPWKSTSKPIDTNILGLHLAHQKGILQKRVQYGVPSTAKFYSFPRVQGGYNFAVDYGKAHHISSNAVEVQVVHSASRRSSAR